MKNRTYGCGLDAALALIGGKWKILVPLNLASGPLRFGELRRRVVGISEKMLIQELKEMELDDIVSRMDFHEVPPRVEYSVTKLGTDLAEALRPLCEWGARHVKRISRWPTQAESSHG